MSLVAGEKFSDDYGNEFSDFSSQLMYSNLGSPANDIAATVTEKVRDGAYFAPRCTTTVDAVSSGSITE